MDTRHKDNYKNKKRFKGRDMNPKCAIQRIIDTEPDNSDEADEFCKKGLASNWSRYAEDTEEDDTGNEQLNAPDFDSLVAQPSSAGGGHFIFSSEKCWESEEQAITKSSIESPNNYFSLNLNLLNFGLQTIPFYKRMDYDPSMFSPFEIKRMNAEAETAESQYKKVLQDYETSLTAPTLISSRKSSGKTKGKTSVPASPTPNPPAATDGKDDELDELLNMTTSQVDKIEIKDSVEAKQEAETEKKAPVEEKPPPVENKEDIQQWLDDILDQ